MSDLPTPPVPKPHNALKGRGPIFYGVFAAGVLILAWQIRKRENSTIQAPAADAVSNNGFDQPSDSSLGAYQGYDSPAAAAAGNSLSGADVLGFVTTLIDQKNGVALQTMQMQYDDAADARSYSNTGATSGVTGGGLSDQPIPNVAPPKVDSVVAAAAAGCPAAFPKLRKGATPSKKNCYKDEPKTTCKNHKKTTQLVHRYWDGHGIAVGTTSGGKC